MSADEADILRRRVAHLEGQLAWAESQRAYLAALHQTAIGLVGRLNVDDLLEAILRDAADLLAAPHGSLHLLSDDGTEMIMRCAVGVLETTAGPVTRRGEGFIGRVWEKGDCEIVTDYDAWPGNPGTLPKGLVHKIIGVPFMRDEKVVGVFALAHSDPDAMFPDVTEPMMTAFAQLASIAIDNAKKVELIEEQGRMIRELGTPIIHVWDQVVTLPLVGVVDSRRASAVMDELLSEVAKSRARFAILDLTGAQAVDTATAGHLLSIARAVKLLGAEGIITGIRPEVAQTMMAQGLDLSHVLTLGSLKEALRFCMKRLGVG